jgi:hypothetical protein
MLQQTGMEIEFAGHMLIRSAMTGLRAHRVPNSRRGSGRDRRRAQDKAAGSDGGSRFRVCEAAAGEEGWEGCAASEGQGEKSVEKP